MTIQNSVAVRNASLDSLETTIGVSAKVRILSGSLPANCAAAQTGTLLAEFSLASNWMNDASAGSKAFANLPLSTTAVGGAPTDATYYRIVDTAGTTCGEQGTIFPTRNLTTNGATAANSNVLNFASTTGVVVGMNVSGTGVPSDTQVIAVTGTTVTMSKASTAGVASAAAITFGGDMSLDNVSIATGQTVNITAWTKTAPGA